MLLNCAEPADRLFAAFQADVADAAGADLDAWTRRSRADLRTYGIGAQILRDVGVGRMRLLARARKMPSMAGYGLQVAGFIEH